MGSLKLTLRLTTCSSLLLWSAALLLLPLRLRPSQRPRLMLTTMVPMDMVLTHMLDTELMVTHTPMVTMERDLLMLSQRLRLMLTMDTHMVTDHTDTEPTDTDTHTDTTERDPLMLISCTEPMVPTHMLESMDTELMVPTHTPTDTTERDLLMLSQRLMLTTDMVMD